MLKPITSENINEVNNSDFRRYAQQYIDIATDYTQYILTFGLPFSAKQYMTVFDDKIAEMETRGLLVANDRKSLYTGWLSPSCATCRRGIDTATFLISNQCPRHCFFCFNPNQVNYVELLSGQNDPVSKLIEAHDEDRHYVDLALTGGEPLLHKSKTSEFFCAAKALNPGAYTRLYTSGSFLDESYLSILQKAELDEIRFSLKTDDPPAAQQHILDLITKSKSYIPNVVVEMPVMPDELELMQELLIKLDSIGIAGINLLELCFPFSNAAEYQRRGYALKSPPFRVLYDYQYAGGLPVAGSEKNCLLLLEFALQKGLRMGIHYCSLENKFSGQIYLQNVSFSEIYDFCTFSKKDYFLKSAKVFGCDVDPVERALNKAGLRRYRKDLEDPSLEFPPTYLERLRPMFPQLEVGISYHVVEQKEGESVLRELRIDKGTPQSIELDIEI
jgi:pyruvate formate-lyase activating enzyme-like uncharacterized protein